MLTFCLLTFQFVFGPRGSQAQMCIVFLSFHYHPGYKLIILANRDEYVERPTSPAMWWPDSDILGGTTDLPETLTAQPRILSEEGHNLL